MKTEVWKWNAIGIRINSASALRISLQKKLCFLIIHDYDDFLWQFCFLSHFIDKNAAVIIIEPWRPLSSSSSHEWLKLNLCCWLQQQSNMHPSINQSCYVLWCVYLAIFHDQFNWNHFIHFSIFSMFSGLFSIRFNRLTCVCPT